MDETAQTKVKKREHAGKREQTMEVFMNGRNKTQYGREGKIAVDYESNI